MVSHEFLPREQLERAARTCKHPINTDARVLAFHVGGETFFPAAHMTKLLRRSHNYFSGVDHDLIRTHLDELEGEKEVSRKTCNFVTFDAFLEQLVERELMTRDEASRFCHVLFDDDDNDEGDAEGAFGDDEKVDFSSSESMAESSDDFGDDDDDVFKSIGAALARIEAKVDGVARAVPELATHAEAAYLESRDWRHRRDLIVHNFTTTWRKDNTARLEQELREELRPAVAKRLRLEQEQAVAQERKRGRHEAFTRGLEEGRADMVKRVVAVVPFPAAAPNGGGAPPHDPF